MKVQQVSPGIINKIKSLIARVGYLKSDIGIVEDTDTATHTISSGQYVIWKNELYKASTAIPSGDPLSSTNLTAVSDGIANELNSNINNRCYIVTKSYSSGSATALLNDLIIDAFTYISNNSLSTAVFGGTLSGVTQYSAVISKYAGGNFASGMVNIGGDIYSVQYNANNQTVTKYKATMTSA